MNGHIVALEEKNRQKKANILLDQTHKYEMNQTHQ